MRKPVVRKNNNSSNDTTLNDALKTTLKISDLVKISKFFEEWDGKEKQGIPTNNKRLQQYKNDGIDSYVSVTDFKQLRLYDSDVFYKLAKEGIAYVYQGILFNVNFNRGHVGEIVIDVYGSTSKKHVYNANGNIVKDAILDLKLAKINLKAQHAWSNWYHKVLV